MKKIINKIFRSDFNRNVLILTGGTAISQVLLILISPVLTRLYTPEAFGAFAIFLSITAIIGGNINLKYELAIMLPEETEDAYKLSYLANYLNLFISLILLIVVILFFKPIAGMFKVDPNSAYWLYLVPVATYYIGFNSVLVNLNNRLKNYKSMSASVIAKNGAMSGVQIVLGFIKVLNSSGLIIGQMVSFIFGNRVLRMNVAFKFKQMFKYRYNDFKLLMKRYKDFPRFAFPAGIANTATLNISNLLITSVYSLNSVGFFSLANRILGAPSVLISQSIGQIYYQKACEEIRIKNNCISIFKSTFKKLVMISVPVYVPLFFLGEYLFPIIFGKEWEVAGQVAKYLTILIGIRFVSSALSVTLNAAEKQKISLINNIVLLSASILVIFISYYFNLKFINFVILYTIVMSVLYLFFIYTYYAIAKIFLTIER